MYPVKPVPYSSLITLTSLCLPLIMKKTMSNQICVAPNIWDFNLNGILWGYNSLCNIINFFFTFIKSIMWNYFIISLSVQLLIITHSPLETRLFFSLHKFSAYQFLWIKMILHTNSIYHQIAAFILHTLVMMKC